MTDLTEASASQLFDAAQVPPELLVAHYPPGNYPCACCRQTVDPAILVAHELIPGALRWSPNPSALGLVFVCPACQALATRQAILLSVGNDAYLRALYARMDDILKQFSAMSLVPTNQQMGQALYVAGFKTKQGKAYLPGQISDWYSKFGLDKRKYVPTLPGDDAITDSDDAPSAPDGDPSNGDAHFSVTDSAGEVTPRNGRRRSPTSDSAAATVPADAVLPGIDALTPADINRRVG